MGAGESLPKDQLHQLLETTNFNKHELQRWYSKFMKDYPDGQLDKEQFREMYEKVYNKCGNINQIAEHIFRTFDKNNDGHICFKELMSSLSVTSRGTVKEKLEWTFNIYDIDGSGSITMEEIMQIIKCMQDVSSTIEGDGIHNDEIADIFKSMDINSDGHLTVDEFIDGVGKFPRFVSILNGKNS